MLILRSKYSAHIIVGVYVDGMTVGSEMYWIDKFKHQMKTKFKMIDHGLFSLIKKIKMENINLPYLIPFMPLLFTVFPLF